MSIEWYIVLSSLLFATGAVGILVRRSPLVILLCLELMLNGANLAFVGAIEAISLPLFVLFYDVPIWLRLGEQFGHASQFQFGFIRRCLCHGQCWGQGQ